VTAARKGVRVAAVGDLHGLGAPGSPASWLGRLKGVEHAADVLVLAGDVTTSGTPKEAELVVQALADVSVRKALVLGNHEFDHGQVDEVVQVFRAAGFHVLEGDDNSLELAHGVGIVGCKGFCGGFGAAMLAPFGEPAIKAFVDEALREQRKLEVGLRRIAACTSKVVVLHYAPIRGTLAGEPEEIYPFLGSSRFAETIDRFGVEAVFHGHAHHGTLEGRTPGGAPVWNVALPVLSRALKRPYLVREFPSEAPTLRAAS
jgi:Icc-related predicted phosphoesterase